MSSLSSKLLFFKKISSDNSPTILTAIAVVGTVSTAILSVKAYRKATYKMDDRGSSLQSGVDPVPTTLDEFRLVWTCYIPPVMSGAITIGCIVMANRVGTKRAAALAAAYTITEHAFADYKDKVVDILGEDSARQVRQSVAQDRVNANPPEQSKIVIVGSADVLCYDGFSGRYFISTMETIRQAQNDVNNEIFNNEVCPLSTFYHALDIPTTSMSNELGWNANKILDVKFDTTLSPDNKPCLSIDFSVLPMRDYWRTN